MARQPCLLVARSRPSYWWQQARIEPLKVARQLWHLEQPGALQAIFEQFQ